MRHNLSYSFFLNRQVQSDESDFVERVAEGKRFGAVKLLELLGRHSSERLKLGTEVCQRAEAILICKFTYVFLSIAQLSPSNYCRNSSGTH